MLLATSAWIQLPEQLPWRSVFNRVCSYTCKGPAVLQVYERAVAQVPPALEKRYWQRYIYLWICYALFEELEAEDPVRTREVYRTCLKLIPHDLFTFAKVGRVLLCGMYDLEGGGRARSKLNPRDLFAGQED